jgi:hypothetical protein
MAKQKRLDLILGAKDRATSVLGRVSGAIGGFVSKVAALAGPLAAVLSVAGVVRFGQRSVQAFFEQEQAVKNLETALINAGDAGASSLAGMQQFASGLQAITTQGDEATLALASKIATLGGLTGGALADATKQTLGLARATGQGADMMGRAYLNALEGNFSMLERYVPALRAAEGETAKMALVQELAANGFKLMESDANTARGRLQQMKNSVGDLMEEIGARLAPTLGVVASRIRVFAEENGARIGAFVGRVIALGQGLFARLMPIVQRGVGFVVQAVRWIGEHVVPAVIGYAAMVTSVVRGVADMVATGVQAVVGLLGSVLPSINTVGSVATQLRDTVQAVFMAIEFAFTQWRSVVELAALKVGLAVVTVANQVRYAFGEVIPSVLKWLAGNWTRILTDMWNFTKAVGTNIATGLVETLTSIPQLISGEKSITDIWGKNLLEGFEATLTEMPRIVDRQRGELEQALATQVEGLEDSLGRGFADFVDRRMNEVADRQQQLKDFFNFGAAEVSPPAGLDVGGGGVADLVRRGEQGEPVKVELDGEGARKSLERQTVGIAALDITRRFLGLGARAEPAEQTAKNTEQAVSVLNKLLAAVKDQSIEQVDRAGGDDVIKAVRLEGVV